MKTPAENTAMLRVLLTKRLLEIEEERVRLHLRAERIRKVLKETE